SLRGRAPCGDRRGSTLAGRGEACDRGIIRGAADTSASRAGSPSHARLVGDARELHRQPHSRAVSGESVALMIAPAVPARSGNGLAMRLGIFLEALRLALPVDLVVLSPPGFPQHTGDLPETLGARRISLASARSIDTEFILLNRIRDEAARLAAFRAY